MQMLVTEFGVADKPIKLLERVRDVIRVKRHSWRTERTYCDWIERFIRFHRNAASERNGRGRGKRVSYPSGTRRQRVGVNRESSISALLFLYKQVLNKEIGWLEDVKRAKKPALLPVVLARDEVQKLFVHLHGTSSRISRDPRTGVTADNRTGGGIILMKTSCK